jgi:hypothetical protein
MNGLLEAVEQTSGNVWIVSQQVYHRQGPISNDSGAEQFDFEELAAEITQQREPARVLAELKREFIFADQAAVQAYITNNRAVAAILLEAVPHLRACFGAGVSLTLDTLAEEGSTRSIYALALWDGDRHKARVALSAFDETWWKKNLKRAAGRVVVDYELI